MERKSGGTLDVLASHLDRDFDPVPSRTLAEPVAADGLAMVDQSLSDRAFIGAMLIAAGMGFAFLRFAKIDDHLAWLYAYLALFVVGYALFRTAHPRKWLHHHLSYRTGAAGRHRG